MTFVALGAFVILFSLLTDYEMGLFRRLRIRFHLLLNVLFGIVMIALATVFRTTLGRPNSPRYRRPCSFTRRDHETRAHGTQPEATI